MVITNPTTKKNRQQRAIGLHCESVMTLVGCIYRSVCIFFLIVSSYSWSEELVIGYVDEKDTYSGQVRNALKDEIHAIIGKQFNNIKLHYNKFNTQDELTSEISGDFIDIAVTTTNISQKKGSDFFYSQPIYISKTVAWNPRYRDLDLDNLHLYRWACVRHSDYCEQLERNNIKNILKVSNMKDVLTSVEEREAEIAFGSYLSIMEFIERTKIEGEIITPKWAEDISFRLLVSSSRFELIEKINHYFLSNVDEPFIERENNNDTNLTDLESAILEFSQYSDNSRTLSYFISDQAYPMSFLNSNLNNVGYIPDIFRMIEARTGISFERSLDDIKTVDIIPFSLSIPHDLSDYYKTNPYMSIRFKSVELSKNENNVNEIHGVHFPLTEYNVKSKNAIFGENTVVFNNLDEVRSALRLGHVRRVYIREDILSEILISGFLSDHIISRSDDIVVHATMLTKDLNIANLLNIMFRSFDQDDIDTIRDRYFTFSVGYGYDKRTVQLGTLAFLLLIIILIFIYYVVTKRLKNTVVNRTEDLFNVEQSRAFLQTIINSIPTKIWIHDNNNKLILNNCESFVNNQCLNCEMYHDENLKPFISDVNQLSYAIETNQSYKSKTQASCHQYKNRHYDYSRIPIVNGSDKCVLTIAIDISDERENQKLLMQANSQAQQAVVARQMFLATMSHELRTPIAGMVGLIDMLLRKTDNDEHCFILKQIKNSSEQLNLLVNDILDFSKLESGQLIISPENVSVVEMLSTNLRVHCTSAQSKGLNFNLVWKPSNIETIRIDSLRFNQVINNVLSNAIKFTHVGQITVEVVILKTKIKITVRDTGIGMSTLQVQHVFAPFTQADSGITRAYGGSGLGLSIVKNLVELMGGILELESELSVGTQLIIELPIDVVSYYDHPFNEFTITENNLSDDLHQWLNIWCSLDEKLSSIEPIHVYQGNQVKVKDPTVCNIVIFDNPSDYPIVDKSVVILNGSPFFPDTLYKALNDIKFKYHKFASSQDSILFRGNVLVAEDNAINALLFEKQLSELGLNVEIVTNGKIALEELTRRDGEFDLLISDYHMPEMDGMQVAAELRRRGNSIPIIGCTAEDFRYTDIQSADIGFNDVLFKPYQVDDLTSVLRKYLEVQQDSSYIKSNILPSDSSYWLNAFNEEDGMGMCKVFIDTIDADCVAFHQALVDKDIFKIKKLLHKIKGSTGILGLNDIYLMAENYSRLESNELLIISDELITTLSNEVAKANRWLQLRS
ncbi:ATP-binding protein [Vibrio pelagius]|uniref:histidine kinase n=1 Tax=Vibrio pelagius TaxID=28169 RepID=A0ABY5G7H1_VIBPE|nr:ATP-binding protein [Vibrio pelagius]UTT86155.1 ATP-binding protein [Vibrio pelagius]